MYREAGRRRIPPLPTGPLLVLTIPLSPVGTLVFLPLRAVWARGAGRERALLDGDGRAAEAGG